MSLESPQSISLHIIINNVQRNGKWADDGNIKTIAECDEIKNTFVTGPIVNLQCGLHFSLTPQRSLRVDSLMGIWV